MIGAYNAESTVSASTPSTSRITPTLPTSSRVTNARKRPRIFGVSSVAIATMNSEIILWVSNSGQRGNNVSSSVKYSYCTVAMCAVIARPTPISASQSGDAR